ncbi:hypothetical protein JST97_35820 [bacterium]|nr:hypothetical protein [bacterium]
MKKLWIGLWLTSLAWSLPPAPGDDGSPPPPPPGAEMAGEGWRPPGPPPGPPGPPHLMPASPERVQQFLQQNYPEKAQQLQSLKAQKPEAYRRSLGELNRALGPLMHLEMADPQRFKEQLAEFKLEDQVRGLARAFKEASQAQKSGLREQLKPLLEEQFQSRQKHERERLQHLKKMVQEMESRLAERESKRTEIIQHHLDELTTGQELRW